MAVPTIVNRATAAYQYFGNYVDLGYPSPLEWAEVGRPPVV
jgi:hypothetical protein